MNYKLHVICATVVLLLFCIAFGGCLHKKSKIAPAPLVILNESYPHYDDEDAVVFNDLPVRLYFYSQAPPSQTRIKRPIRAKVTIVAKDGSCRKAGIEGLKKLQRIAVRYKENAVINIRASWNGEQLGDETTFGCILESGLYSLIWEGALADIPESKSTSSNTSSSLRKLEELYYQGLITKEEFQKRRADILSEL